MAEIVFGEIDGYPEGSLFESRQVMTNNGVFRNPQCGIDGNGKTGAAAIVLSGGYKDDEDLGDVIIYTGAGGRNRNTGRQIEDQTWKTTGNAALRKSMNEGLPVRVFRGYNHISDYSPESGYKYAGLYHVLKAWQEVPPESIYKICRFKLVYTGKNELLIKQIQAELDSSVPKRKLVQSTIIRVVRDTKKAIEIKKLYNYKCQVCKDAIIVKNGLYAEGAHIRPIGAPHNGDDSYSNLLCLCPNHHVMFDKGSFCIKDNLDLDGVIRGTLTVDTKHKLDKKNLKYHRNCHGYDD